MVTRNRKAYLIIFSALLLSFNTSQDDSRRFIRIGQVQIPNSACIGGSWATIINSNHTKSIRVHYTMTVHGLSTTMTCDARPSPLTPNPNDLGTLIGCTLDIDYKVTGSEYLP